MSRFITLSVPVLMSLIAASSTFAAEPDAAAIEFFETRIRPVFVEHCQECHSSSAALLKGGLRLDHREGLLSGGDSGPAIILDKPETSPLLKALKYDGIEMPPKGRLSAQIVADFEQWVKMGAPDPRERPLISLPLKVDFAAASKLWSFQRPERTPLPAVQQAEWPQQDLDRFILARLEQAGMKPSPQAERRVLIRRAYFDVIGLPPTPEEVEAFINDPSPQAYVTVVNRLMDSPHYGERWGRHWLDIARYGEDQAHTFKARNYPQGFRYRDWVVESLNQDLPYDRFLSEQIAGDLLGSPSDPKRMAALGMFALGPVYYQDNGEQAKALADEWDDRIDTLTRGVLGLTISCARCHDHKFDPITTADYYALAGVFASSDYQERPIVAKEVLDQKAAAESAWKEQQLLVDRFLDQQARQLRPALVSEIPQYWTAAWKAINHQRTKPDDKQLIERIAKEEKLSELLLKRWVDYLNAPADVRQQRPSLSAWNEWVSRSDSKQDLSGDAAALAAVQQIATDFQAQVVAILPQREQRFAEYGENFAFVNEADRATVDPGIIPLGNLFDDPQGGIALSAALSTDKFLSAANENSLGVDRVVQGWGKQTQIAKGINFDFSQLGSDQRAHGGVINDGWDNSGAIRTQGQRFAANSGRTEQGIGMHANALITFDLGELRQAGLMPADQRFVFRVDRAGLNDDTFGNGDSSAHLAVIVSRPHRKGDVFDGIIAGYVNGQLVKTVENDQVYYFSGEIPPLLKADGQFVKFEISIPAEARYLTLVSTGAGVGPGENTISSDHTVFSGARLECDPLPEPQAVVAATATAEPAVDRQQQRLEAKLLSELFYDQGLLALPSKEAETKLPELVKQELVEMRGELERVKKNFDGIHVLMAHSLAEGQGRNLPIYLQGNPTKPGGVAPRSMPIVFTEGTRLPWATKGSGRAELAAAIASRDNPLTARVIVNRVWRSHFGFGLVRTPSNFGQLGDRPTHPELLDNLAVRFMDAGWSLKTLHREILLSATYQQQSDFRRDAAEIDPENLLLWRMNRRRLEVEPWRDAMLAVTGELDRTMGGPSVDLAASHNRRRTLYAFISRHQLDDLLRLFDFPDPNITSDKRSVTTVPLQQLFVLNSDFMTQRAKALIARLNATTAQPSTVPTTAVPTTAVPSTAVAEQIRKLFGWTYGRQPTENELRLGEAFLATASGSPAAGLSPWERYALALLGTNEFSFID